MKEECNYCKEAGRSENKLPILYTDVNFGVLGIGRCGIWIARDKNGTSKMDLRINLDGLRSKDIVAAEDIAYCPICGRALTEDK